MKNPENLMKVKRIAELMKDIRKDNNLINQDLVRYARLVYELRNLLEDENVTNFRNQIEEIFITVDINKGFTTEGVYKNPYMAAIIKPTNETAKEFHEAPNKMIVVINEAHHENSLEFKTLNPDNPLPHCKIGTIEVEYAESLQWILDIYPVFEKNCTMAAHAPGYLDVFNLFPNLKRVVFAGGITDMCYIEAVLPTRKYFDQHDMDIEVVTIEEQFDTYDATWHNREEWNDMAKKFMTQAGIKIVKKLERK